MMKIAVICAMQKELELISRLPAAGAGHVECRLSGIGKVNAAISAYRLIRDSRPDAVMSLGAAGTFSPSLREGDTVIAQRVAFHDIWCGEGNEVGQVDGCPRFFQCDPSLVEAAARALPTAFRGLVISGDQFFISAEEDRRQKALYPDALCVDMESAAVAQVCHMEGVPFIALKVISDTHLDGRQAGHYEDFWDSLAERSFAALDAVIKEIQQPVFV